MLLDFNSIEEKIIPQMRGGEKEAAMRIYDDGMCKILRGRLIPGASIGMHTHVTDSETIFIRSGSGKLLYDDGVEKVCAGSCHYCPNGHSHSLINDGEEDLVFEAIVPVHKQV